MNPRYRGLAGLLASLGVVAVAAATPAGATVYERLQTIDEPYSDSYTCSSTFQIVGVFNGRLIVKQGTGPATEAFPVLDNYSFNETHTNTATGRSFTVKGNGIFHEVKARQVDGNVFEFRAIETGQPFVVEDATGKVVLRDRGAVDIRFLFDTLGDGMPGGNYFDESFVASPRGPRPSWDPDFDFCALAESLTSG